MTLFDFFKPRRDAKPAAPTAEELAQRQDDAVVDAVLMSGVVLPPYPALLEQLDHLMARDDFELGRLVDIVSRDPSITAALLRVANSPVFGLHQTLTSLRQAVTVLGLARTRAVLRSEVLRDALRGYADPSLVHALWERFGEIGNLTASLATRSGTLRARSDLAYSAGIFHGTGCFILTKRFPNQTLWLGHVGTDFEDRMEQMDAALGTDHAAIGAMVARGWRLPREVADAIAQQHRLRHSPELIGRADPLACLLRLAIVLHDGSATPDDWPELWDTARDRLGLDAAAVDATMAEYLGPEDQEPAA